VSHAHTVADRRRSHKALKCVAFVRGPMLAIKAAVLVCALTAEACLVPQSVDQIVTAPHPPPHFVLESIRKELLVPIIPLYRQGSADAALNPPCHCELELSIPLVQEDDPTVVLQTRWFVDYNVAVPTSVLVRHTFPSDLGFNTPDTIRQLDVWDFDADAVGVTSGIHVVDVVVGEKAGFDDSSNATRPNQTMLTNYSADTFRFVVNVNVQQDPSRPTCPAEFPSVRVCR
jgi:hypothetical protein